ncbi:hypothetical protein TRFO_14150 [Tritrichomonas foetus]|uniref:Uncharacterized protein n=1 Tax=Tritrichomonas foetus TaxID=1144522 RepID=A0A1J4KWY4_9EUKA|nr:hypothetical protein TRFO_14150 [Tritrichomonas foetus]|eukprot:OHT15392.1 hypothetical protein TRFO_14150 [Tritrichomonas foetus]
MLTKSCELEAKLDTIESKKAKRQGKTNITSVKKSPSSQQSQSMVQTKQTITSVTKSKNNSSISEIIPKLASPSKVLIPEKPKAVISSDNKTIESLISLIQNLANEISEMHEEQNILKNQIEKMQEFLFSDE